MAPATTTKTTRIGGPLLGRRESCSKHQEKHDPISWRILEPILYTVNATEEQFVLLPNKYFISVLAYATGKQVATLVPRQLSEKSDVIIESLTLARYPKKAKNVEQVLANDDEEEDDDDDDGQVLLVGCQDGAVREFSLVDVISSSSPNGTISNNGRSCGRFNVTGKCCIPRRVITLSAMNGIKHLVAPPQMEMPDGSVLLYSVVQTSGSNGSVKQKICRSIVPPFDSEKRKLSLAEALETIERVTGTAGQDKKGKYETTIPFRLLVVANKVKKVYKATDQERDVFVVVARANGFKVYHERITDGVPKRSTPIAFNVPTPLSAMTISPNGCDIACGHSRGEIRILTNAFQHIIEFHEAVRQGKSPGHVSSKILVRNVHWHAHPVTSLSYQQSEGVDPLLYSGGDESVLVVWQLARGTNQPADTLPRLAKGGLAHIVTTSNTAFPGIMMFCEDNTLQLVQGHSLKQIWKIHGMAKCTDHTIIRNDSDSVLMSGLDDAPGYLHWLDPRSQRVEKQLEVAPFNRVSRTDEDDAPMPQPTVTHTAFCEDSSQLLTIETVPTENTAVGKKQPLKNGRGKIGVVSSVKFWARGPERYFVTASMTFPHGERNRISAVAMSEDGQFACTVSNDERAFRLWRQTLEVDEEDKSRRRPVWICQYKVTTPSGYSNFDTPSMGVKFSSDGTTLCIVYGHMITLWDHRDATLLNSLNHINKEPIREVQFVNTDLVRDSILSRSKTGVKLQSPYGHKSKSGWSTGVPTDGSAILTQAQRINGEQIGISIYFPADRKTKIVYVNASTGEPTSQKEKLVLDVPFKVQSMVLAGPRFQRQNGFYKAKDGEPVASREPAARLFVMSVNGELFLVQSSEDDFSVDGVSTKKKKKNADRDKKAVPKIHMPPNTRKREEEDDEDVEPPAKRAAVVSFMGEEDSTPIATSELPLLSGNFMRAFVGRNVSKRQEGQE